MICFEQDASPPLAGNDAHQNAGLQGFYTPQDTFKLSTTAPGELLGEWRLNAVTRFLLRLACGPLRTDGPLFRFEADRYGPMLRHVNNHLWVRDDAEPSLLDSLRRGRSLIAFTHLAGARGFQFWAETPTPIGRRYCMMSEEMLWRPGAELNIHSPMPCRFTLLRDGKEVRTHEGYDRIAPAGEPGEYLLEAELFFMGEWVPQIGFAHWHG